MAPRYMVDAERPLRGILIQEQFRFWLEFRLRDHVYKRWFASAYERDNYVNLNILGAELISVGEEQTRTPHAD